ncbi:MAG: hypothetical protein ACYDCI_07600 [Candidatus Limnocylindrales bacterium]
MSARTSRAVATALTLLAFAIEAVALILLVPASAVPGLGNFGSNGVASLLLALTFPIVGWLIASRRGENRVGWMFLVAGFFYALTQFSSMYAVYGLLAAPGSLPLADVMAWLNGLVWAPAFTLLILLLLFFPDGRLPSRRWRPVVWIAGAAFIVTVVPNAVALWPYRGPLLFAADRALPAADTAPATAQLLQTIGVFTSLFVAAAGVGALFIRFRRSDGAERQQIKWFASAAVVEVAVLFMMSGVTLPPPFDVLVALIVTPMIPIAVGVAILRYRLYDIDRIISRTIAYAAITAVLVATFAGAILLFQALLDPLTGGNTVAVAVSTLIVAALFQPLRRRVQRVVDRRFNRSRYDAERTVAAFAGRLRDEVELDTIRIDLLATVTGTLDPSRTSLWVREAGTR